MDNIKLQQIEIEESPLSSPSCLEKSDQCFFFGDYASRLGYQHSPMNQLIFNLKKQTQKKGQIDWQYKEKAIEDISKILLATPAWEKLKFYTWVPLPPSATKGNPLYDDRLFRILKKAKQFNSELDIREMLLSKADRQASHLGGRRMTISEHLSNLTLNKELIDPRTNKIVLFDDIITSGASFKAAQKILKKELPDVFIIGIFIARAITLETNSDYSAIT